MIILTKNSGKNLQIIITGHVMEIIIYLYNSKERKNYMFINFTS